MTCISRSPKWTDIRQAAAALADAREEGSPLGCRAGGNKHPGETEGAKDRVAFARDGSHYAFVYDRNGGCLVLGQENRMQTQAAVLDEKKSRTHRQQPFGSVGENPGPALSGDPAEVC